jgi:glyoxylase-like metal-dependent hydrolase (beta-lactamase superfamily II)
MGERGSIKVNMKIHLVKTRLVNSYVVEYSDRLLVIDVAMKCHRYVLGFIDKELKRPITDVKLVICTHDDPDHIGGVASLARLCGAKVAVPFAAGRHLKKWLNNPTEYLTRFTTSTRELFRARAWSMYLNKDRDKHAKRQHKLHKAHGEPIRKPAKLDINHRLKSQQLLPGFEDWQVIHTPGHSWDSCCFYHPQTRSLITGDTLLGSASKNRLVVPAIYASRRQTLETLDTLSKLAIQRVYPGHGSVISGRYLIGLHNLAN